MISAVLTTNNGKSTSTGDALLSTAAAVSHSTSLEALSRPLLDTLHELTGLESVYLTEVRADEDAQTIKFADNRGDLTIPEGLTVPWEDTLCRRALDQGLSATSDVERDLPGSVAAKALGLKTYVSVPVRDGVDQLMGTLCGASVQAIEVSSQILDVMTMLSRLIALQWQRDQQHDAAVRRADSAEERLRERATFLAVAEHKLKSPVALLRGWSDLLVEGWADLPDDVRTDALRTMQEAARDAARQVDELLLEARGDVLSNQLEPEPVELGPLVLQVARQLQGATTRHEVLGSAESSAVIQADRRALWQVLWHLGENAVKYSPDGGRIDLTCRTLAPDGVLVQVCDQGIGVPDDVDVFAPFVRGTSEDQADIPGTGLGLHIVHNLVHAMGGTVSAQCRSTGGSVFSVTLPRSG